jgi:hypothetical protein
MIKTTISKRINRNNLQIGINNTDSIFNENLWIILQIGRMICRYVSLRSKICYDFRIKTMFGSSWPPVVSSGYLIYVICVCLRGLVSNTCCVVFIAIPHAQLINVREYRKGTIKNEQSTETSNRGYTRQIYQWLLRFETTEPLTIVQCNFCIVWCSCQRIDMSPHSDTHYPDSKPISLCSFSLMLRAQRRSNKYQFYSLWLDPTRARTHDLPHSWDKVSLSPLHQIASIINRQA